MMAPKMKILAGCILLLVAVILLGGAFMDFQEDADDASRRITREFAEIHDEAALNRDFDENQARKNSETIRAVAGAAFLASGLFVFGTRRKSVEE
jgi:hypothetical protein